MGVARAGLLPPDAELIGEFSAGQELGLSFTEPDNLDYLNANLQVFRSDVDGKERFDVCLDHAPLDAQQLMGFLVEVAPHKGFDSLGGTIADWGIVEQVSKPRYKGGDREARRLVSVHEHLGDSWFEFLKSRRNFMDVLRDGEGPNFSYFNDVDLLPVQQLDRFAAEHLYTHGSGSLDKVIKTLEEAGVKDAPEVVWSALEVSVNQKRSKKRGKHPITRQETMVRRYNSWNLQRKREFLRHIASTSSLDVDGYNKLVSHMREKLYDEVTLEDGTSYAYPKDLLDRPLADIFEDRETVLEGLYEGQVIRIRRRDGKMGQHVLAGSIKKVAEGARMSPLISWRRGSQGERKFIFERDMRVEDRVQIRDGVLGALSVAYFSPDIRSEWPERMPIRGGFEQRIRAAQVPVLALMRRAELLKSDFVDTAESVAA